MYKSQQNKVISAQRNMKIITISKVLHSKNSCIIEIYYNI